jgi:type I restriction enzyme S subunit
MEVRPGYKQTEVGVIPEDWDVRHLVHLTSEIGDGIHSTPEYVRSSDFYFINGNNLVGGTIQINDATMSVSETVWSKLRKDLSEQSLLMSINGTIGNLAYYRGEKVILGKSAAYLNISPAIRKEFIFYSLSSSSTAKYFEDELTGTTIRNLSLQSLRNTPIPIPREPNEQRAIAGALGDVDALLGALIGLIAKKRDLKQAAMQQLLTGQTRLPGFSGEWKEKRLGEIGAFIKGKGIKKDELVADGLPCIRYGEIYTHYDDYIGGFHSFIPPKVARESQRLRKGDLLFAGSGETAEEIGKCVAFLGDEEAYAGGDIVILSPADQNSMYLGYLMNHSSVVKQKARMGQGDAIVHISARNLARLNLRLPLSDEETAIAAVLSDMDAEIAALEQRLAKTRALKQGMMQELLIGRTRLTVS